MKRIEDIITLSPVIPVLAIENKDDAVPLAEALIEGGLRALEITLRTPAAIDCIKAITAQNSLAVVGAGTVLNTADYARACDAGAQFIVSPGISEPLLDRAKQSAVPLLPGILTASELMRGLDAGLTHFKFFPAEIGGGTAALKALAGPFPHVRFCPTGGITFEKAPDYLELPNVICVGGSWLAPKAMMERQDWRRIAELARAAAQLRKAAPRS
ncbi:MAG TPA: bifunctional 4-hydroxy-2-oxoglutarate aldolase/2-dehydro-3-deoxy-phosphogluconate aldolase [Rhizomicrobium sp.]|nr:bifunctional 4-hydroxy-2-oxoglutarate aldolase/2-dehydro-3-deoxy-phosphogluconate aldolase [Rhizomicrobium sp.]